MKWSGITSTATASIDDGDKKKRNSFSEYLQSHCPTFPLPSPSPIKTQTLTSQHFQINESLSIDFQLLKHWDHDTSFMTFPVTYEDGLHQKQENGREGPLAGFLALGCI